MIRMSKPVASALGALLVVGVCGVASAQTAHGQPPEKATTSQPSAPKQSAQEKLDRDKVTMKDHVQGAINASDANIDALKRMAEKDKGNLKKRDTLLEKRLSDMRGRLQTDLDKIDKATTSDWKRIRSAVLRDVSAADKEVHRVAAVTKVPTPRGAASKQPKK
jgi:hypothetical protein